jgi:hypothetical protein
MTAGNRRGPAGDAAYVGPSRQTMRPVRLSIIAVKFASRELMMMFSGLNRASPSRDQ